MLVYIEFIAIIALVAVECVLVMRGGAVIDLPEAVSRSVAFLPAVAILMQYLQFRYGPSWRRAVAISKVASFVAFTLFVTILAAQYMRQGNADRDEAARIAVSQAAQRGDLERSLREARARLSGMTETARSADIQRQIDVSRETITRESDPARGGCKPKKRDGSQSECAKAEAAVTELTARLTAAAGREAAEKQVAEMEARLAPMLTARPVPVSGFEVAGVAVGTHSVQAVVLAMILIGAMMVSFLTAAFGQVLRRMAAQRAASGHRGALDVAYVEIDEPRPVQVIDIPLLERPDPVAAFVQRAVATTRLGDGLTVGELRDACRAFAELEGLPEPCAANAKFGGPLSKALGRDELKTGTGRRTDLAINDEWNAKLSANGVKTEKKRKSRTKTEENVR